MPVAEQFDQERKTASHIGRDGRDIDRYVINRDRAAVKVRQYRIQRSSACRQDIERCAGLERCLFVAGAAHRLLFATYVEPYPCRTVLMTHCNKFWRKEFADIHVRY